MIRAELRLPRLGDRQDCEPALLAQLRSNLSPLWRDAQLEVPTFPFSAPLRTALENAVSSGQIVRGLEGAERMLDLEARGLELADAKSSVARGTRISRLIVMTSDGSERFYRNVEALLLRHGPRLLALRLEIDTYQLGACLFGEAEVARLALLVRREAVVAALLALLPEPAPA